MKEKIEKKEIGIIFSSKEENKSEFINHLAQTCGLESSIYAVHNPNGASLSSVYYQMVTNKNVQEDIIVTVHDDVEFLKKGWGKELKRLFDENKDYGIIGVAGSAQFDDMGAWWRYKKIYGQVLHRNEGKSWLTTFSPLLDHDLEEVAVIDGLFMAFMPSRIKHMFDPTLGGFDFYDIDFCLNNYVHKACKIGVTTNIRMAHNSIGRLKESWEVNKQIINKKYGKYYPIDIEKDGKEKLNNLKIEELVTLLDACKMLWDKYNTNITIGWLSDTEHPNLLETKGVLQRHIGEIENTIEKKIEDGIEWQVTE